MGVERWFERKSSHLRGEAKVHLDRSHFSVGAVATRPQIAARGRIAASSAISCAMGALGLVRVSNTEEGTSSAFHRLPTPEFEIHPYGDNFFRQSSEIVDKYG